MCRDTQTVRYFSDGITAFRYLTDGFFHKFRCKSWCAHTLLLCSNYRAGSSTGVGSVHLYSCCVWHYRGDNIGKLSNPVHTNCYWLMGKCRKPFNQRGGEPICQRIQ
ncbi:hypothetical protein GEV88_12640 [Salmonella enterica]|nr:hypothetical protein [Salmonella enterica]